MMNRVCTIVSRSQSGAIDELGNATDVLTSVATTCNVQQTRAAESPLAEWGTADYKGFFPIGTTLDTGDAVEVDGLGTLEVVGIPDEPWNPRLAAEQYVRAWLRMTAGAEDSS